MSLIIVVTNISALSPVSDYKYEVLVGDGTEKGSLTLERGKVLEHRRSDGWVRLLEQLLEQRKLRE